MPIVIETGSTSAAWNVDDYPSGNAPVLVVYATDGTRSSEDRSEILSVPDRDRATPRHLVLAHEGETFAFPVQEALGIRRIHFVPLKEAVHRDQPGTPAELRCALVQAAVADQPGFVMDDRELHRHGPSWSYYTLESFRREYAVEPLAFIMGGDAFIGFL